MATKITLFLPSGGKMEFETETYNRREGPVLTFSVSEESPRKEVNFTTTLPYVIEQIS